MMTRQELQILLMAMFSVLHAGALHKLAVGCSSNLWYSKDMQHISAIAHVGVDNQYSHVDEMRTA